MEANDRGYWVHACRPSIAGKPATNGGQTSCITPGQDAKNRVQTICGYQVHTWRHQSLESRLRMVAKHPASRPGRMLKIGCKPYAVIRSIHGGINRRKAGYEWWPNNLYHAGQDAKNRKQTIRGYRVHVRWPSIAGKAGSSRSHKPFASAYTFISGDGAQSWP
ncbi:hypothetical protein [Heyndrickxia faecalis]|uniref:hypothetical protein n=1 Tax=Heyndrickxia faecalis TaxID=2824910 RepID=UPI003D21B048